MARSYNMNDTRTSHRVDVIEPESRRSLRNSIRCEIGHNIRFDTSELETYCVANWDRRIYDAFVVVAAVQFCDHTKARPSSGWSRDIRLRVSVHDPDLWGSRAVSTALHHALAFLTGDRWEVRFRQRRKSADAPHQPRFDLPDSSCVIIPFSDGIDSRSAAGLAEREHRKRPTLVRLGSSPINENTAASARVPFASVPYRIWYGERKSVEPSARSRGFKFSMLSGIAAYLCGSQHVIVPESGQGSLGAALVPVGQTYEDYRNHPLFTNLMAKLIDALFGHRVRYEFPHIWKTKAETLSEFLDGCDDSRSWSQTRSCWHGARHASVGGRLRQCGLCAACLLRRMSVHSAGLAELTETYVWENLRTASFEEGAAPAFDVKGRGRMHQEYGIAGALHLDHLAKIIRSPACQEALNLQVFRLSRALTISSQQVGCNLRRMLTQHEKEWEDFVGALGAGSFVNQWVLGAH